MDVKNIDCSLLFKKSMANVRTNLQLVEILKNTDKILCPESARQLAEIYFELKAGGNYIIENREKINIDDDLFTDITSSIAYNMELIEEIAQLDLENDGGNLGMCLDAIENRRTLDFSDFTEKADIFHMRFREFDGKRSLKSSLVNRLR